MVRGRRSPQQIARLGEVELSIREALDALALRQAAIRALLFYWGIESPGTPPDGFRWKTQDEYRAEYTDAATTAGRKVQILAIRAGMLPPEAVQLPPRLP